MSIEKYNFLPESETHPRPKIPDIYHLIESGAPTDKIVHQIYSDFYGGSTSAERLCLGLEELLSRGHEGLAALSFLGKGSDDLAVVAQRLSEKPDSSRYDVEELLGVKRWKEVGKHAGFYRDDNNLERIVAYAKSKGYIPEQYTVRDCLSSSQVPQMLGFHAHLDEIIDDHVFTSAATFGSREPTYLEMLGPKEILRLRELEKPVMLLMGTLGKYSAREFTSYAKKINPNAHDIVIDLEEVFLQLVKEDPENSHEKNLVAADATQLPFADASIDLIHTNYLFRFLYMGSPRSTQDKLKDLFSEAQRVLKPGGSLLCAEDQYGQHERNDDTEGARKELMSIALQSKFEPSTESFRSHVYALRAEVGSAKISDNGFPDYRDSFLLEDDPEEEVVEFRFVKPAVTK